MTVWAVVRRRDIGRLAVAGFLSEVGDWMLLIAFPLFVLQLTGSPLVTATVFVLQMIPTAVAGPVAGVLIDRVDKWRLMTAVALVQAFVLLPLLAADSADDIWIVYAVVAVQSVLGTIIEPCRATTAASLAPAEDLMTVNQVMGVLSNFARLIGAPLGGLVLGVGGIDKVLLTVAAIFLASAVLFGSRRGAPAGTNVRVAADGKRMAPLRDWVDGLRVVARNAVLRRTMGVVAVMALAQGAFVILFVLFVIRDLGGDEADVGILRGVQAIGALVGGVLLTFVVNRIQAHRLVAVSLALFGGLSLVTWNAPAVTTVFAVYVGLFIAVGVPGLAVMTGVVTLAQTHSTEAARGRVISTLFAVYTAVQAVGMLAGGLVGTGIGLTIALQVQAALYFVAGLLALRLTASEARQPRGVPVNAPDR